MNKMVTRLSLFVLMFLLVTMSASAQATRTWVSGVGDDVNPCSRTAPCKTFAGAISKTASGGEIDVLDPGGFGTVTITKPITIDGTGTFASSLASATTGFLISSSVANTSVTIRGISINGAGTTLGTNGIRVLTNAGATVFVHVEDCVIQNFSTAGINVATSAAASIFVRNSVIRNNAEGMHVVPTGGTVDLHIENCQIDQNSVWGVNADNNIKASIVGTSLNHNLAGLLVSATTVEVDCDRCDMNFNTNGIFAGNGGSPVVRLTHCMITGNATNGVFLNGGTVRGFTSNLIEGNGGNNTITTVAPQ
ncbi:MAG TPA: right-handed parallel beta-helix repeat-containing protein [Thermoanaerobaculia bacterium]|nr:right-handed parallel beta-helix repeat-containing protein [Thermoanaerobaculia bacterium]